MMRRSMFSIMFASMASFHAARAATSDPFFTVVLSSPHPVITERDARAEGIYGGFETGMFTKAEGKYHYIATELGLCPWNQSRWDSNNRLGHWVAERAEGPWTRHNTLYNTRSQWLECGLPEGRGAHYNVSWSGMAYRGRTVLNGTDVVWILFFITDGFEANPDSRPGQGARWFVSTTDSIYGPYVDGGWALQDTDSFSAFEASPGEWLGFHGWSGHTSSSSPDRTWVIGLVESNDPGILGGPFQVAGGNSLPINHNATENPLVIRSSDGEWFLMVFDALRQNDSTAKLPPCTDCEKCPPGTSCNGLCWSNRDCPFVGLAWSRDGRTWDHARSQHLNVQPDHENQPCGLVRTPLGLVPEPDICKGCYSILWTGWTADRITAASVGFKPVCHALIRNQLEDQSKDLY